MSENSKNIINDAILKNIHELVHSLKSGTVIIKVLESKIVKIEKMEEQKFDDIWIEEGSGI